MTPPDDGGDVTVVCVGDVMMAHALKPVLAKKGGLYPFEKVRPLLEGPDILFGNLENPVAKQGTKHPDKEFNFLMDPPHAKALARAGFKVMSLANNHILDFGPESLAETRQHLQAAGILGCGAGPNLAEARKPAVLEVRGRRVAFLAYSKTPPESFAAGPETPGTAMAEEQFLKEDIPKAKKENDWVLVSFHWGQEYTDVLDPDQRRLARLAAEAGADLVIGHHPHMIQGVEVYKRKIIFYSLGNFVFGTRNSGAEGLLLRVRLSPGQTPRVEVFPLLVDNHQVPFQPVPLEGTALQNTLARLKALSLPLGASLRLQKDRALIP